MPKTKIGLQENSIRSLNSEGFYTDYQTEDTLHSVIIRSPAPTGKIKRITADLPEGYFIYTSADIPGNKYIRLNDAEIKIFGYNNVSYTGEPVAILVGPDKRLLDELVEKVTIDFDIQSLESALENVIEKGKKNKETETGASEDFTNLVETLNEMPSLNNVIDKTHIESNEEVIIASRVIKTGLFHTQENAEETLFEDKDLITQNTWSINLEPPNWIETTGAYAYFEEGFLHIYVPTKWTNFLMNSISQVLKFPKEKIIVHKTKVSGIFSKGLWRTTVLAVQVAVAAYLSKKPVKLEITQQEQNQFFQPGVQADFSYTTALSTDGNIIANKIEIDIDLGSLNPFSHEIVDRLAIASCNYYSTENLYISVQAHTSKNPPTSISIKSVCSPAFFAAENQMQALCTKANLFPLELRQKNAGIYSQFFPFKINLTDYEPAFENTVKISDFNRKYASFDMDVRKRLQKGSNPFFALPLRGIGIASAYNNSGYYGASSFTYNSKLKVTLTNDNRVLINAIKPSEEIEEIWKTTAAEILEIKKENIFIDSSFALEDIPESPEDAFSSIGNINELIKKCCNDIQKRRFHEPLPLEATKALSNKKEWNKEAFEGNPFGTTSFAVLAVEVELDAYTYNEKIKGIWITIDCGEILDETAARRKLSLEIQQILSMLVKGNTIPCEKITIQFIKSNNKSGQIGDLIQNTLPAAFSTALSQALATRLTTLPCTEQQIYELIKDRDLKQKNSEEAEKLENEEEGEEK